MAISGIVTLGYGSWGNINLIPLLGYGSEDDTPVVPDVPGCITARFEGIGRAELLLEGIGRVRAGFEKIGNVSATFERCE